MKEKKALDKVIDKVKEQITRMKRVKEFKPEEDKKVAPVPKQ